MYEIFMTRGMHHYTVKTIKEAAASCALVLAMPMFIVTAKKEMYQFLKYSKARAKGTEYK